MSAALGKPFMPHQRYIADVATEVLPSGEPAYDVVIIFLQRRGGKTVMIAPVTAHRCGQADPRSAWLTAQKRDNARKRWMDASDVLIRSSLAPRLHRKVSHSFEELSWRASGSKFVPFAPDAESMHGEDPDLVFVDELWAFGMDDKRDIQQGYRPAWSVKPGQEWLMSAAGNLASGWMKHERARGRAAVEAGLRLRVAYFEWCVPTRVGGRPVEDLSDAELVRVVLDNHPRRDHGLRTDAMVEELVDLGRPGFLRAYGGIDENSVSDETVIARTAVQRALSEARIPDDARVGLAFDVDPDRRESSVSTAWRGPDGVALTEVIRVEAGTRWLAPFVAGLAGVHDVGATAVNNVGAARDVADELEQLGIDLLRVSSTDYPAACARFSDEMGEAEPTVTHDGHEAFLAAVENADRRKLRSGGVWSSKTGAPVTALVSHTLAVWAADHMTEKPAPRPRFRVY